MLRRLGPLYSLEIVSHRLLRYGSGILHVVLLATSLALVTHGWVYDVVLAAQLLLFAAAAAGCRHRAVLLARLAGDARRALELPAARRARDVDAGGGMR